MLILLEDVRLRTGETVEAAAIRGPDLDWAERIEALLGHKPPFWCWQNSAVVRRDLGLDAHFYVLHRGGDRIEQQRIALQGLVDDVAAPSEGRQVSGDCRTLGHAF